MLSVDEKAEIRALGKLGTPIRKIALLTNHDRQTIRKVLVITSILEKHLQSQKFIRSSSISPFKNQLRSFIKSRQGTASEAFMEIQKSGYDGSLRSVQRFLKAEQKDKSSFFHKLSQINEEQKNWMHELYLGAKSIRDLEEELTLETKKNLQDLVHCIQEKPLRYRKRAVAVLASMKGIHTSAIARFLLTTRKSIRSYLKQYRSHGSSKLLDLSRKPLKKSNDPKFSEALFRILHAPPSTYGFNRTTWRMEDLYQTMIKEGYPISRSGIRSIIRKAGYKYRKAKKVLTSNDPEYKQKIEAITGILSKLQPNEKFFSVDEFGPFAIKVHGGRSLMKAGELRSIPQHQRSKGSLIITGAVELSTNQVTHFYSPRKNTEEIIKLLDLLLVKYSDQKTIYFSWDAASWHASKRLYARVNEINSQEFQESHQIPMVQLVPLPTCAQFLNVIESIYSGLARAVLHNSDYLSVEHCKAAIDRYFDDRNSHFRRNPKRAGNKLWGKERVKVEFKDFNNCKDPLFR